ncbi:MAG: cobalt-precorrin-6A reductase [Alphaproteobacteria bacterium]|nr:cobalt-precorrin-6A reductase [Alphaproteobacteria bacterium]
MRPPERLLILGGTGEAAALAAALDPYHAVVVSLAGRTRRPAAMAGELRRGGFGGAIGLARYLAAAEIAAVVDATHPFAARISASAAAACRAAGIPLLRLERPEWTPKPGDRWRLVADAPAAARALPRLGRRAFLTTGRQTIGAFAAVGGVWFLVRLVEAPDTPLDLPPHTLVIDRGPFAPAGEVALMRRHRIDVLVTKASGGAATAAKLIAARALRLPVLMIRRPLAAGAESVATVAAAEAWVRARLG